VEVSKEMNGKHSSRALILTLMAAFIFSTNLAYAKSVTFQREYTYQASEADSKLTCRAIALEQVKRLLLEELGTYLEAKTEVKNYQLTKDQITTLTAGIVQTEILDEKWDGEKYRLKAKIIADPNEVARAIDALRKNHQKTKQLEEVRKRADKASKEVEDLKKELATLKGEQKNQIQRRYNKAVKKLAAIEWFKRGLAARGRGDIGASISALTKAIQIDPDYSEAYLQRSCDYDQLGQYEMGIADCTKALQIDPTEPKAYLFRAASYFRLGDYERHCRDLRTAVKLWEEKDDEFSKMEAKFKRVNVQQMCVPMGY